jgi:hypothetical protein
MIWLLKWQQTIWLILLASLVWHSGVISVALDGREWLMEEQSSYGHGQREWVERWVFLKLVVPAKPVWL